MALLVRLHMNNDLRTGNARLQRRFDAVTDIVRLQNCHDEMKFDETSPARAGRVMFIEFHLVVPGTMTVLQSHDICDRIEAALKTRIPGSQVVIHVEPDHKAKAKDVVPVSR